MEIYGRISRIKKAEMSSKMIVSIILLIAGLAILLLMFYQIEFGAQTDREVCHNSVILRGSLPTTFGLSSFSPLKCKTKKVCITSGLLGGECREFEGVKNQVKEKVKSSREIEEIIANEIIGCWSMMGEGRISLFSQHLAKEYGLGTIYPSCVICSRIAFDKESLDKKGIRIGDVNVIKYMMGHKIPRGEMTYFDFLTRNSPAKISVEGIGESIKVSELKEARDADGNIVRNEKGEEVIVQEREVSIELEDGNTLSSDNKELAVLFMQISAPSHLGTIKNSITAALGIGVSGSFIFGPKVVSGAASKLLFNPVSAFVLAAGAVYQQGNVAYNKALAAGYCGDVSSKEDARVGCSVVRTVNYDAEELKKYCSVIESIS